MLQHSRAVRITTKKLSSRFRALKTAAPSGPIRTVIINPARAITNSMVITVATATATMASSIDTTVTKWIGPAG